MSETEHIKGKLIPTGNTINEFLDGIDIKAYHSNARECFEDEYYNGGCSLNEALDYATKKVI